MTPGSYQEVVEGSEVCIRACSANATMGWLRSVGSIKLQVSFAE